MRIIRVVGIALLAAGVFACSKRETRVEQGNREGVLHLGNGYEPNSLDPAAFTSVGEYHILSALFEPLLDFDAVNNQAIPRSAESWDISDDGCRYTFHLRRDSKWSNGDPLTAADFVYAYRRVLHPKLGSLMADRLFVLANAREFYDGEISDPALVGCVALDDHTLQLTLREPVAYFLTTLFAPQWFPIHQATIEQFGAIDDRETEWTRPGNLVGNGPFVLKEWKVNDLIRVERNPHYRETENVQLNAICFYPIESVATEERAFRSGQLHVTSGVPTSKMEGYENSDMGELRVEPRLRVYYLPLNVKRKPLDDARVRRALALSLGRRQLAERLAGPGFRPAFHFSIPGAGGYTSPIMLTENVDEAKQLMADAGFPDGNGFPRLEFSFDAGDLNRNVAEAIQQMWQQHLGIGVDLVAKEFKVHVNDLIAHDFEVARISWTAEFSDPLATLKLLRKGAPENDPQWSDPQYDKLINAATTELDPVKRFELCQKAEAILLKEMPVVPVFYDPRRSLIHPSVKGWSFGLLESYPYRTVYLDGATPTSE